MITQHACVQIVRSMLLCGTSIEGDHEFSNDSFLFP